MEIFAITIKNIYVQIIRYVYRHTLNRVNIRVALWTADLLWTTLQTPTAPLQHLYNNPTEALQHPYSTPTAPLQQPYRTPTTPRNTATS